MSKRRVVVTGLGMLSPVGNTVESTWKALLAGQSGISLIDHFDTSAYATKFAGLVKDFNCEDIISRKEQRKMDAFIQYGIVAGVQAMQDSGLEITEENATRIGAAIGSGIGGLGLIEENHTSLMNGGPRKISPGSTGIIRPMPTASSATVLRITIRGLLGFTSGLRTSLRWSD